MYKERILLGQLVNLGDCLYATTVAKQIKKDFPECHLTWAISERCRTVIDNNPFVDDVWIIEVGDTTKEMIDSWCNFERLAKEKRKKGDFDKIFLTQISPNNFQNYDGTVRTSILRGYPAPITVSCSPVVRLSDQEITNVRNFIQKHNLVGKFIILFECFSRSGQSFVNPEFAIETAKKTVKRSPQIFFVLTYHQPLKTDNPQIISGHELSFRENAELTKYSKLLIGSSSGVSWLCTSDWAKKLPMIQLLKKETSIYASFIHDYEYRKEPTDHILEMTDCTSDKLVNCIETFVQQGFNEARQQYHEQIPLRFNYYFRRLSLTVFTGRVDKTIKSIFITLKRYGLHPRLIQAFFEELFNGIPILFKYLINRQK